MQVIVLLAATMAAMGIIGYRRGVRPEAASLAVMLAAFALVEKSPQRLVSYMNALYIGFALVIKSGLNDLSAGDLEAAAAKLRSVERPFADSSEGFALLAVMIAAAAIGYLLQRFIKSSGSPLGGAIVGMLNGYILSATFLPWLSGLSGSDLPVPLIRDGEGLSIGIGGKVGDAVSRLTVPSDLEWLSSKGGLPMIALLALLFIFAVWRMRPRKV